MTRLFDLMTRLAIRLRWPTIIFTLAVVVLGIFSLTQLNQELLPNIEFPVNVIVVRWPAESAEQMVEQVTIPMENALGDLTGVLDITGESGNSFAFATVRSEFGTGQEEIRNRILDRLDGMDWPEGLAKGVNVFAPELLDELTPEMLASLAPDSIRALPDEFITALDPTVRAELDQVLLNNGKSVPLPQSWIDAAAALSIGIQTTADVNPDLITLLVQNNPEIFVDLTDDLVLALAPPTQLALPDDVKADLSDAVKAQLDYAELPASWQAYGENAGIPLRTVADVTPEALEGSITILAFDLSALPVINVSASSDELSLSELKTLVADRVVPELEALEGVGAVDVGGGQAIDPEKEMAAKEALQERIARRGTGPRLPLIWSVIASQQGTQLGTVGDLTPDFLQVAGGLGRVAFAELTPEMLRAMAPDVLAALPGYYVAELDDDLRAELDDVATPAGGLAEPEPLPPAVPLPESWLQAAEDSFRGMVAIETTADLGPLMVSFLMNPGGNPGETDLLADLTPDVLNAMPPSVLGGLPTAYYLSLDEDFRSQLSEPVQSIVAQAERREALKDQAPILPASWVNSFAQLGFEIQTAADLDANSINITTSFLPDIMPALRPDIVLWLAEADPNFLTALSPASLQLLSAETLAAVREAHPDFWESLEDDTRALLDGIADGLIVAERYEDTVNRTNGEISLRLSAYKERDANTVTTVHKLDDRMQELEQELGNIRFDVAFEQASFIEESISGVAREGALGAIFAVIVIMAFLSGQVAGRYRPAWRSTLVTAVSIPTSILAALALLWLSGNTLNIMTLSGLTVAIGRVVDDSIVVLENIYRHIQRGDEKRRAVIDATREVANAIFASTATTVVVFLPLGLIGGIIGEFFLPFALAVTFALVSSFFVAVTLVPLLAYLFIDKKHLPEERVSVAQRGYARILGWVLNPKPWVDVPVLRWFLNARIASMVVASLIILGSMVLMARLPQTFIPSLGEPTINIGLNLPGNDLLVTDATAMLVEEKLDDLRQAGRIETYQTIVGSGGIYEAFLGGGVSQNQAALEAVPAHGEDVEGLAAEIRDFVNDLVGVEYGSVSAADIASSGFGSFELVVTAANAEDLARANDIVLGELNEIEGLINVASSLRLDANGELVTIGRSNGEPAVTFTAEVVAEDSLGLSQEAQQRVKALDLPAGASVTEGFATEQQTSGFTDMGKSIGISVIIVYAVMVLTFGALLPPFDILFSLPFAVVGAAIALTITDRVLGISSMVGLMMLVGIVVTNAIVLLELVQQLRQRHTWSANKALIDAGSVRLRPIWMTALAAILALVPLAIGVFAEGVIIGADLATVVIGGLLFSTLISLVIVPIVYSLTDSVVNGTAGRLRSRGTARRLTRVLMGEGAAQAVETEAGTD